MGVKNAWITQEVVLSCSTHQAELIGIGVNTAFPRCPYFIRPHIHIFLLTYFFAIHITVSFSKNVIFKNDPVRNGLTRDSSNPCHSALK